ncbi:hypothetical protein CEXT_270801, partial [Caerostris extrusa]
MCDLQEIARYFGNDDMYFTSSPPSEKQDEEISKDYCS